MSENSNSFTPTPYDPSAPAHFTPTQGNYRELKPFRFWCQKVLPLVYDDSLSYYELLCKVVNYLNETMEDVDTLHTDVDNLHEAYEELQADYNTKYAGMTEWINQSYQALVDFVNTYFDELDVQEEINNKLDEMTEDGTLTNLISAYVDPIYGAYEERINSDVTQQNTRLTTLENRMDTFSHLTEGSTTGDAELADIRVGANGVTYSTAGDAVRGQYTELYQDINNSSTLLEKVINDVVKNRPLPKIYGRAVNTGSSTVDITTLNQRNNFAVSIIACSAGDVFTINASGYGNYRSYAFVSADGTRLSASGSGVIINNEVFTAPANSAYLVINDNSNRASYYGNLKSINPDEITNIRVGANGVTYSSAGDAVRNQITDTNNFFQSAFKDVTQNKPIFKIKGKVINLTDTPIDINNLIDRSGFSCSIVPCSAGDMFTVTASGYGNYRSYAFIDSAGTRLSASGSGVNLVKQEILAPTDSAYLIINDSSDSLSYYGAYLPLNPLVNINKQERSNIYDCYSENIIRGYYINVDGRLTANENYIVTDYMKVDESTRYYLKNCVPTDSAVYCAVYDENLNVLSTKQFANDGYVDIDADGTWLRVSIRISFEYRAYISKTNSDTFIAYRDNRYARNNMIAPDYWGGYTYNKDSIVTHEGEIYKASITNQDSSFNPDHWIKVNSIIDLLNGNTLSPVVFGNNSFSAKGSNLNANTNVELGYANIAKNVIYELCCTFNSFTSITVGQGASGGKYTSWIVVDNTNITTYLDLDDGNPRTRVFAHGLTIDKFLNVRIETTDEDTCYVEIQTDGGTYRTNATGRFYGSGFAKYFFKSGTAINEYDYRVIFRDANKPVWLFGDSYMSFSDNRWIYYLKDINQFNNVLINACGGLNSSRAVYALNSLSGSPKYALWAIGMNDASDVDSSTPNPTWLANTQAFIQWCADRNCTPILGTIPTTPDYESGGVIVDGKYNEGKNGWIRNSGYRYVDFAKAYGADGTGAWYSGMLTENDWVHPTILGAKSAFHRALADMPELVGNL